jgi:hypothetical protein
MGGDSIGKAHFHKGEQVVDGEPASRSRQKALPLKTIQLDGRSSRVVQAFVL